MYLISNDIENEIVIKKSRFIGKLIYIDDINKVNDIIEELKAKN